MEQLKEKTSHLRLSSNFMKKSLSLFQPPYLFSLLLFFSSLLFLIFHTLTPYFFPSSLISMLKFSFDRNHMFLLCNGILVILVKSSSSSSSLSSTSPSSSPFLSSSPTQPQESIGTELGSDKKQGSESVIAEQSSPDENPSFLTVRENSKEELKVSDFFNVPIQNEDVYVDDEQKEEEEQQQQQEEAEDGLAAEELNKRCEEFIRKIKRGIISESRGDPCLARFC